MMVSFILFLLPALLATTSAQDAIACETCSTLDPTCPTSTQSCTGSKAGGGCFAMAAEVALDGTKVTALSKGCVSDSNRNIKDPITFTVETDKYLRINAVQCSDKDNCNTAVPNVPQENKKPNNLQCPTCFALNSASCNSQNNPCTGDETSCIDFTGTLKTASPASSTPFAGKGCATKSAANIKTGTILLSGGSTYEFTKMSAADAQAVPTTPKATTPKATTTTATTATTSGGSPALGKFSFALFLPGLTGLLLVKLLS